MKEILILPISGGSFHIQLFLLIELIKSNINKPDIILGNSGGCINSYLLLYSNLNINNIKRVLYKIDSSVYCKSWWFKPLDNIFPSFILGYFNGSFYNNGSGFYNLFNNLFNSISIQEIEIWSLKVNFNTMKGVLCCNKDKSFLDLNNYNYETNNIEKIKYNKGNIKEISNDCISSCSIPVIVPPKKDKDDYYIDGGMLYASPLTPLANVIRQSIYEFHIIYISSLNIEDVSICNYGNLPNNTKHTIDNIMLGSRLVDRMNTIKLISNNPSYEEGECNINILSSLILRRYSYTRSLIELYPNKYINLNIMNFNNDTINEDYKNFILYGYSYRFWYS